MYDSVCLCRRPFYQKNGPDFLNWPLDPALDRRHQLRSIEDSVENAPCEQLLIPLMRSLDPGGIPPTIRRGVN